MEVRIMKMEIGFTLAGSLDLWNIFVDSDWPIDRTIAERSHRINTFTPSKSVPRLTEPNFPAPKYYARNQ